MTRGEVWTVSGSGYAGQSRPAVIIQSDRFADTASVTLAVFTSDPTEAPLFRLTIEPTAANGLHVRSAIMVDKITSTSRANLGNFIGRLSGGDLLRLNQAIVVFLGVA